MAGITKQMAIPYFVQFPTKYFAIFSTKYSHFFKYRTIYICKGKIIPTLDFLSSTYYIYNKGIKSTK